MTYNTINYLQGLIYYTLLSVYLYTVNYDYLKKIRFPSN